MAREHYWTGSKTAQDQEKRALAAEHDRQVRVRSVANDFQLGLPVSVPRPDGEEYSSRARLRSHDNKRFEIQKPYIQGPPNKTVWDSIDCTERTVNQPSSSSSRSGGSKSAPKGGSNTWLSWSRSNKSSPSQGRSSRGQQRHPHASNPSTSVRNAPNSSSCETGRGSYGGGGGTGGLLAGPSLSSSVIPSTSSPSTLGSFPNSSSLGFHGAATSLVAGDNVHCAFHNHHPPSSQHPPSVSTYKQHQQPSLGFSGGGAGGGTTGPSIAERFSEKVQHCTNALVGNHTRTSPNNVANNSSSASSSTSVLSRLIDPDSKLFSRSGSKDSKRSNNNNGKNGKSHRTDQSSSASSSPGGSSSSLVTMVDCSSSSPAAAGAKASEHQRPHHQQHPPPSQLLHHEQLQQHYQQQHHHQVPQQLSPHQTYFHQTNQSQQNPAIPVRTPGEAAGTAVELSSMQSSSSVPSGSLLGGNSFFTPCIDSSSGEEGRVVGGMMKHSNINVMMPLRSKSPDNNNPSCSSTILSGGSRSSSRTGPSSSSSSSGVRVRMMTTDAYCGADAGAIHNNSSDNKDVAVVGYVPSPQQQLGSNVCVPMTQQQGQGSVFSDCENGNNARVPVVGEAAVAADILVRSQSQHCGIVKSDTNYTLKLSQSSSSWTKGEQDDALVVRDEEMKRAVPIALGQQHQQQQQQQQTCHHRQTPFVNAHSPLPEVSFKNSQQHNVQMSSSVPASLSSSSFMFNCSFNNAAALLPRDVPPTISPTAATTTATVAAAAEPSSSSSLSCCSVKEKKRNDYETCTFSSSGCSTDPNYSTFAKINHNNNNNHNCNPHQSTPSSLNNSSSSNLQSQNENNNFSLAQHVDDDDDIMISESCSSSVAMDASTASTSAATCSSAESPSATGESMMMQVAPSSPLTSNSPSSATPLTTSSSSSPSTTASSALNAASATTTLKNNNNGPSSMNNNHRSMSFVTGSTATTAASNFSDSSDDNTSLMPNSNNSNTSVRETAHLIRETLSEIASKEKNQYCTPAATAELITTSLHSSSTNNSLSSSSSMETSSTSQALSLLQQQPSFSSSTSSSASHHHH